MKSSIIFACIFLLTYAGFSQSFEGQITYAVTYKTKQASTTDEQWGEMLGTQHNYFLKGGNYYALSNGTVFNWQRYISETNKYYYKLGVSSKVFRINGSINETPGIIVSHKPNAAEVMGHKCDELVFKTSKGSHTYYYSADFPVDPKLFTNHRYGDWAAYLEKSRALPLKEIVENNEFTMEIVATEIQQKPLDSETFKLPADIEIQESP